jgi:hypothetical protein
MAYTFVYVFVRFLDAVANISPVGISRGGAE